MSEFLAEAQVLIRPNTAGFRAALIAELAAATAGIVVPVSVIPVGGGSKAARSVKTVSVAQKELAVATTAANAAGVEQVNIQQFGAAAATRDAIAQKKDAIATVENARAHEQLARGAGATALNLAGVRGATLAASAPFLVGAATITIFAKATHEAVAEQEALARVEKVLGPASKQLESDAKGLADQYGLSATQALHFEGAIATVLEGAKISQTEIPKMSEDLVKLAADMAAFNNVPIEGVLKTLQLSILGNTRGIKALGVELGAADVNARALALSGKENTHQLNQQDRILARISLLYERTANQQGAAARRSGNLAQETKILTANFANLGANLGSIVTPELRNFITVTNLAVSGVNQLVGKVEAVVPPTQNAEHHATLFGKVLHFVGEASLGLITPVGAAALIIHDLFFSEKQAAGGTGILAIALGKLRGELASITAAFAATEAASRQLKFAEAAKNIGVLEDKLLDLQFQGASPAKIIANLRAKIVADQAAIANAPTVAAKTAAKIQRNQAQDQINAIIAKQKADAKAIADKATSTVQDITRLIGDAADFVKQSLADATQRLLDSFALDQGKVDLQQARAERTKSLVDDLAGLRARAALLQRQIVVAKKARLDAQEILNLEIQLAQTRNQIAALHAEQTKNRQQLNQQRFDRASESVQLDIQLAQTNKDIQGEINARKRQIVLDEKRKERVKGDILATKRLRNDIAEQNAAIADLRKQLGQRNNLFKQMSFEFLQAQQGFAANLISNLIPHGSTAGLVGGGGGISTPTLAPPERSRPPDVGAQLSAAAQTSTGPNGASSGQMAALIHINRQMLGVLERLSGQRSHPEAAVQKAAQAASMDIIPW